MFDAECNEQATADQMSIATQDYTFVAEMVETDTGRDDIIAVAQSCDTDRLLHVIEEKIIASHDGFERSMLATSLNLLASRYLPQSEVETIQKTTGARFEPDKKSIRRRFFGIRVSIGPDLEKDLRCWF
jgi:hypothetical protein